MWSCIGLCSALWGPLIEAGELPPPPASMEAVADAQLYLELVVNQMNTGQLVQVQQRAGQLYVQADVLQEAGIHLPVTPPEEVGLDSVPGLHSEYDIQGQRLLLDVPPDWLPEQILGRRSNYTHTQAMSSFGVLFNYDMYLNDTDEAGSYLAAWNEVRVFESWGTLSSTGQYRRNIVTEGETPLASGYLRYDTTWRFSDEERLLTYEAGDLISGALAWTSAIRMGGVQVSRDFGVRPDLVTYPLPQFSGEAAVPSSVDLFINGYKSSSENLQPGPYTLTNVPFINGAGEAVVVTTDALGRQVSTSVPFYVTSTLLQQGLSDYSVAAGSVRRGYGIDNFAYGPGVTSGSLRYGLTNNLTLESHLEASDSLTLGGVGGNLKLGHFGVLNSAVSQSQYDGRGGRQVSLGYQYSSQGLSFAWQRLQRLDDYADLTVVDTDYISLSRRSEQVTLALNLDRFGSLGAGYFDVLAADATRTRLLNLSWSKSLWLNSSLYVSANRELGDSNWAMQAQIVVPFDLRGNFSAGMERSSSGVTQQRVNYSRSVPTQGGVGYNLGYARGDGPAYRQADLTWRLQSVQLQAGVYGSSDQMTRWADASGSLVWMDGQTFAANRIDDAFVVVSTGGFPDVGVRYENQWIGNTDKNGHLLVPWSSAYYRGKYEIDPLNLSANIISPNVEQRVAVRRGSGYLLEFELRRVAAASVHLIDARQQDLALGSAVLNEQNGERAVVGWDGLVYLENLVQQNSLQVIMPDGQQCKAQFALPAEADQVPMIEGVVCQ
ncbi:fimbria/pilus outer membrane usher protein [Pseudomonas bubulae]|uniref:fimbria/pilus outer membrane usher protein n=1 Tax=Pseudomonas bubulae TaxID=2316085 RepID=UPI001F1EE0F7|nr:fimbria/pilus outer membrane usher protein [Pseudomonas bubulae]MCF3195428.1 fimbria/pilus outer membrane usher protein [Pseudomonas bubulae]